MAIDRTAQTVWYCLCQNRFQYWVNKVRPSALSQAPLKKYNLRRLVSLRPLWA